MLPPMTTRLGARADRGGQQQQLCKRNDLETINHYELSTTGWYTFEWNFRDYGDGTLAVDLKLYDAAGNWLWTETRHDASDIIGATVGGEPLTCGSASWRLTGSPSTTRS
jgi:hypothetical protein